MKIIAYFLPQYHEVEENNKWWGKGFTEWTTLQKAQSYYKNHCQPKKPLNDRYYNLLEKETMIWQTNLMKKYNIDALCYYHYWFDGKKMLEKPAENLLKWKDINQKFCFCWANHDWKRTWNNSNENLMLQTYGDEESWLKHFEYLKEFFLDSRYIKINNKPLFVIYDSYHIENFDKMVDLFDRECKRNGFNGIYVLESFDGKNIDVHQKSEGIVIREPNFSINLKRNIFIKILKRVVSKILNRPELYNGNWILKNMEKNYKKILDNNKFFNKKIFPGAFISWDNTPRHKKRGYIINRGTDDFIERDFKLKEKFFIKEDIEYIFFNAWNEWTEGMYLEPDEENKYDYLKLLRKVINKEI